MPKKTRGIFITLEGTEGSGKSTLIRLIAALLEKDHFKVTQTREPGGSPLAEQIRTLVLNTAMDPKTELLLYEAARSEHLAQKIIPALKRGEIVLCDRFIDSTLAYQASARGLSWKEVKTANRLATGGVKPDLTLFLDIDPKKGLQRAVDRNRFEEEGVAFQKKVRAGYLKARAEEPKRWITLNVENKTPEQLAKIVLKHLNLRWLKRIKKQQIPL